ncbi:MAG: hypothetical protein J6K46_04560 [Sutterella sp.]|nr:hypothetical protein [Sutterella sp.]
MTEFALMGVAFVAGMIAGVLFCLVVTDRGRAAEKCRVSSGEADAQS